MKRDARVYIEDILEAITKIEEYTKELKSDEEFYKNTQIQEKDLKSKKRFNIGRERI